MKLLWESLDKLKTTPTVYAKVFPKFEKAYPKCKLTRNEVKFIFDRMIDFMCTHNWPEDIFDRKSCIRGISYRTSEYFKQFFMSSGMVDLYKMHHALASKSNFYFTFQRTHGMSKEERKIYVEEGKFIHLVNNKR